MLYIQSSINYAKLSKDGKFFISSPSNLVNNFLVRSFDKFGVLQVPDELLQKVLNNPESSIPMQTNYSPIFSRPVYGNADYIFKQTLNKIKEGIDIYSDSQSASLFIEWYVTRNEESAFIEINTEVPFSEIGEAYSKALTTPFHPNELEMLLKLFSLFYAKEMSNREIKNLSKFQVFLEKLADKEIDSLDFDMTPVKENIQNISTQKNEFGTNNIFNKILGEIQRIEMFQHYGYEIDKFEEFAIIMFRDETKQFFAKEFVSFLEEIDSASENEFEKVDG